MLHRVVAVWIFRRHFAKVAKSCLILRINCRKGAIFDMTLAVFCSSKVISKINHMQKRNPSALVLDYPYLISYL